MAVVLKETNKTRNKQQTLITELNDGHLFIFSSDKLAKKQTQTETQTKKKHKGTT